MLRSVLCSNSERERGSLDYRIWSKSFLRIQFTEKIEWCEARRSGGNLVLVRG